MNNPFARLSGKPAKPAPAAPAWLPVLPVPDDAPAPPQRHPKLGKPSATWTYRDAKGRVLGYALRFDGKNEKQFRPLHYFQSVAPGNAEWRWEAAPAPRALYGLERLAARPAVPVLVCEGEKAADAASQLVPGHCAITSPAGSKSAAKADWSVLCGRAVTIWPDADASGADYATAAAGLCHTAGAASVAILAPPAGVKPGWDAADAQADGWTPARALALVQDAPMVAAPAPAKPPADKANKDKARRPRQCDGLIALMDGCSLWHGSDGEPFITLPDGARRENWPLRSPRVKQWLAHQSYQASGRAPGTQALEEALRVQEARACSEGPQRTPWRRVGARDGKLYIDLADESWQVIEIGPNDWRVLDRHDCPFVRSPRMRPLCEPEAGYGIDELRAFANVASEDDFVLVVFWLLAALRDRGPYPILVLNGEQGSGKSSFSRRLRALVDPSSPAIQGPPKDEPELVVTAQNAHLLVFDNLSHIDAALSDALCRLATGSGFATRAKYTDKDENIFEGARPIILNGIPSLADRADLAERAITIRLAAIPEDKRRPEDEQDAEFELARPRILGALCTALSAALRNIGTTRLGRYSRMADFEKWGTASEPGLGWEPGTLSKTYAVSRKDTADTAFENNIVAVTLVAWLDRSRNTFWEGTATELLSHLNGEVSESNRQMRSWPKTVSSLGMHLARSTPVLRAKGVNLGNRHSGNRSIVITRSVTKP